MTNLARILTAASVTAAALIASPAMAVPVGASTPATAKAQIVKPLTLTATQNLDFGTILLVNVTASTPVSISQAGVVTCGTGLSCSGAPQQAKFGATGTNNQVVKIYTATSTITNGTTNLTFTPNAPASILMTNAGAPGTLFSVGGSFNIDTATTDGVYTGNMNVTVDYN